MTNRQAEKDSGDDDLDDDGLDDVEGDEGKWVLFSLLSLLLL